MGNWKGQIKHLSGCDLWANPRFATKSANLGPKSDILHLKRPFWDLKVPFWHHFAPKSANLGPKSGILVPQSAILHLKVPFWDLKVPFCTWKSHLAWKNPSVAPLNWFCALCGGVRMHTPHSVQTWVPTQDRITPFFGFPSFFYPPPLKTVLPLFTPVEPVLDTILLCFNHFWRLF